MLKPGMLLQADIIGERRKLIEWVFEPLLSLGRWLVWIWEFSQQNCDSELNSPI